MQPTHYRYLHLVYDRWQRSYGSDFSDVVLPRLTSFIDRRGLSPGRMLDVACGTGTLAISMARHGWHVWGIDASEGMLSAANRKAEGLGLPVVFLLQDMRAMKLDERFHLATCFYDSLNHLRSESDLAGVIRCVGGLLEPGGFFLFDLNNKRCFEQLWKQSQTVRGDDFTLRMHNHYNPLARVARSDVTLELRAEDGTKTFRETVFERYFPDESIAAVLRSAGLRVEEREDMVTPDTASIGSIKTLWVAQKP